MQIKTHLVFRQIVILLPCSVTVWLSIEHKCPWTVLVHVFRINFEYSYSKCFKMRSKSRSMNTEYVGGVKFWNRIVLTFQILKMLLNSNWPSFFQVRSAQSKFISVDSQVLVTVYSIS